MQRPAALATISKDLYVMRRAVSQSQTFLCLPGVSVSLTASAYVRNSERVACCAVCYMSSEVVVHIYHAFGDSHVFMTWRWTISIKLIYWRITTFSNLCNALLLEGGCVRAAGQALHGADHRLPRAAEHLRRGARYLGFAHFHSLCYSLHADACCPEGLRALFDLEMQRACLGSSHTLKRKAEQPKPRHRLQGLYTEMDFRNEALNSQRMSQLMAESAFGAAEVVIPKPYMELTTR